MSRSLSRTAALSTSEPLEFGVVLCGKSRRIGGTAIALNPLTGTTGKSFRFLSDHIGRKQRCSEPEYILKSDPIVALIVSRNDQV
jgi:hypothetical protein